MALLSGTALASAAFGIALVWATVFAAAPALADGGAGGAGDGEAGSGGTLASPNGLAGGDGVSGGGGGGGGGGPGGGIGGAGGHGGIAGFDGNGGAGGAGGLNGNGTGAATITNTSPLTGGSGDAGVLGGGGLGAGVGAGGGGGGAGGYGAIVTGTGPSSNTSTIAGGQGGNGGDGGSSPFVGGAGGNGGDGGVGVQFTATGASFTNSGSITGGAGGGAGIVGAGLNLINSGTIAGGFANAGAGAGAQANAITLTGGTNSLNFGTATSGLLGNVGIMAGTVQMNAASGGTTVDNIITGAGGLIQNSANTLTLSGANTYTGATNVIGGTLQLGNFSAAGTGVLAIGDGATVRVTAAGSGTLGNFATAFTSGASGTLAAAAGTTVTVSNAAIGANSVAQFGSATDTGTIVLDGTSTASLGAHIIVAGGTLTTTDVQLATFTIFANETEVRNGATLDFNSQEAQISRLTGGGTVKLGTSPLQINGGSFTGGIQGAGGVTVGNTDLATNGTLILGGTGLNTYTGATTVTAGHTLQGAATNAFAAASATIVTGTLDVGGFDQSIGSLAGGGTVTNSGTGAAVLTANGDNTSTSFSGVIQEGAGTIGLTKTGSGTLTLSGANTYIGATTINGGTMLGGLANVFSASSMTMINTAGTLDLGGFAQSINAVSLAGGTLQNGALTGAVRSAGGTINGIGGNASVTTTAGTTTLEGVNAYTGATTVNGGTLQLMGSITGTSGVTVNSGGTLTGSGIIDPPAVVINSGGTFAPGNGTPGSSTTIAGNLAFQSGAVYLVQISPATASFASVSGTATLGGATVNASFAPGAFVAKQYIILSAGALSGSFNGPVDTNLPSGFHTSLSTDQNNAFLNLALNFVPPPNSGLTTNQQRVGNAITGFFNANGGIAMVFGGLTPAGLTQASGETAVSTQQTTFDAMTQFMGVMTDPFVAGRGDGASTSAGASRYAEEGALGYAQPRQPNEALAAITTKAPQSVPFEPRWSVWAAGFGGSQATDGNAAAGSNNTTSRVFGTAVGADYRFSPDTLAGFALAGGGTNFSVANGGSGSSDLFQAGAFVRHNVGAAYISAVLAYGWQDVTTDRIVTVAGADALRARFNANAYSGRVEGGDRFVTPWMGITPYGAAQFTTFDLPAYAEGVLSGANTFALAYGAKSVTDPRSELGLRTDKSFALSNAILTLRGRAAWAHDFDPDRSIGATFQALPGASFVVNGAAQASDSALVTASAEMKWSNGWSAAATFEGEFSDVTESYAGKGVVRYAW